MVKILDMTIPNLPLTIKHEEQIAEGLKVYEEIDTSFDVSDPAGALDANKIVVGVKIAF